MIDIKTLLDAALVKAQAAINEVNSVANTLMTEATKTVTLAANTADGGVGAEAKVTVPAQEAFDALKAELESVKTQYNTLLASHPTPPEGAAPLPLEAPLAEKAAE